MADINIERKTGSSWLWWVLGLLLLALIIWLLAAGGEEEMEVVETEPIVTPATTPAASAQPMAQGAGCLTQAIASPVSNVGQTVGPCQVQVAEVPTDRGFWVEENGQRVFAIIGDRPAEQPLDLNPGQSITISEATVRDRSYISQIAGQPLDQNTQNIINSQAEHYLVVDESNINITEAGTPQPGTTPAQTAPRSGA